MTNLTLRSRVAMLATILIAPIAGVSAASLIDQTTSYTANSATAINTNANINAGVNINASATSSGNGTSSNKTVNINNNSSSSASVTPGRYGGVEVNAGNSGNIISIDRSSSEVTGGTKTNVTVDKVRTQADLKAFAASELRNDENFSSLDIDEGEITIKYKQPAKFLGFLSTKVNVVVEVNSDGTVDIKYPWYSFLSTTNKTDLEAAIEKAIASYTSTSLSVNGTSTTTTTSTNLVSSTTPNSTASTTMTGVTMTAPSVQASLIARIHAVLKSHLTNSSGTASTTVSAN